MGSRRVPADDILKQAEKLGLLDVLKKLVKQGNKLDDITLDTLRGAKKADVPRVTHRPPFVNRPSLQANGHPLPDPRTLRMERGPDGLVRTINGRPVNDYVQDLSRQRNDLYRQLQTDRVTNKDFTKAKTGSMNSVVFDRRTGEFFEADNRTLGPKQPTNLHPTLQVPLNDMENFARQNPNQYSHGPGQSGGFPHPDTPGTHSEVASANQALWAREAHGLPTDASALEELTVDNRRLFAGGAGTQAACCANCTAILGNIDAIPGKKTTFP